jgi:hypothetical protein
MLRPFAARRATLGLFLVAAMPYLSCPADHAEDGSDSPDE